MADGEHELERAQALTVEAQGRNATNDRDQALRAATEATRIYRKHKAEVASDDVVAMFAAGAADVMASVLAKRGRADEAVRPARESVEIYERIATEGRLRSAFRQAKFCNALRLLAAILGQDLGDTRAAMEPASKALGIAEKLARQDPASYNADLSRVLLVLAAVQDRKRQSKQAVTLASRAVAILRQTQGFEGELAVGLNNLATYEYHAGNKLGALALNQEAVVTYRDHIERYPSAFEPNFGRRLEKSNAFLTRNAPRRDLPASIEGVSSALEVLADLLAQSTGGG